MKSIVQSKTSRLDLHSRGRAHGSKPLLAVEIKMTTKPSSRDFAGLRSFAEEYPNVPRILVTQQARATLHPEGESLPVLEFLKRFDRG